MALCWRHVSLLVAAAVLSGSECHSLADHFSPGVTNRGVIYVLSPVSQQILSVVLRLCDVRLGILAHLCLRCGYEYVCQDGNQNQAYHHALFA